jgi:NAD(P)-dependent dehydrogenase (short-subunit alcohol dehydrogenase family)
MDYSGKTAIVTGGGRGIGRSIALAYAVAGARVVIAEKDADAGKDIQEHLLSLGHESLFVETDVSIPRDIGQLMAKTIQEFGRIDILVNNAGVSRWASPYELKVSEWDAILNTNLRSVFLCSREAARHMRNAGGGSVVNIASTRALMSEPNAEAYAASKGGILALTHALATSFAQDRIQVNCISPGWIETRDYQKLREVDHKQHISQRVGRPEDVARACLYLTAPGNDFVTGINLIVDGGMTRKMIYEH